jgi:hypothetical protein
VDAADVKLTNDDLDMLNKDLANIEMAGSRMGKSIK